MRDPALYGGRRLAQVEPARYRKHEPSTEETSKKATENHESISDRIVRVREDLIDLEAFYKVRSSPTRYKRLKQFFESEIAALQDAPFDDLDQEGKLDHLLLRNYLRYYFGELQYNAEQDEKVLTLLGASFPVRLAFIIESRQDVDDVDGKDVASELSEITREIEAVKGEIMDGEKEGNPVVALRATKTLAEFRSHLHAIPSPG